MRTTDNTTTVEQTADANAEFIRGLREVADFLERHPEFTPPSFCEIHLRSTSLRRDRARQELEQLAAVLGSRATEEQYGNKVSIEGAFAGGVALIKTASTADLAPIITPRKVS